MPARIELAVSECRYEPPAIMQPSYASGQPGALKGAPGLRHAKHAELIRDERVLTDRFADRKRDRRQFVPLERWVNGQ